MTRPPKGIDERLDQLRPPVVKGSGTTESERYLAQLAERSFLNLWSYPSPFRNQKQGGKGDGKELCDLLVVCGRHIIIFSEKTIEWPGGEVRLAWSRWSKRAIKKTAEQAKGAVRWITNYPDRIFLDRSCERPFPIELPARADSDFHIVVVAKGAENACRSSVQDSSGSLIVSPRIAGDDHWLSESDKLAPFRVGDVDPSGPFVHVFDDVGLDIILGELDTVRDFTDYLDKRAEFIRSGQLLEAHGEENLLAFYAIRINDEGDHDFVTDGEPGPLSIDRSHFSSFRNNPQYIAKKKADKISYLWDALIEAFTTHMLDGTSITLSDYEFDLKKNELGVRYMALQGRFARRHLGMAVADALEKGKDTDRFFRLMIGPPEAKESETGFFIFTFKYLDWMEDKGGYEKYRLVRTNCAHIYAKGVLEKFPHLDRVIGVCREPPGQGRGISEDMIYAEQFDWSEEDREAIRKDCDDIGVLQGQMKESAFKEHEYPDVETVEIAFGSTATENLGLNRHQKRAKAAKARKRRRH